MKTIPLTHGKVALVDDEDFAWLSQWKWYFFGRYAERRAHFGEKGKKAGETVYMHKEILRTPKGKHSDHINGNKLDNRRSNLRVCTASQNLAGVDHRRKNTFRGVQKDTRWPLKKPWKAMIKCTHLGMFSTAREAAKAYDKAAKELYGDFALLNF